MPVWPSARAAMGRLVGIGGVTYFGTGQMIGAFRLAEFKAAVRRGGTR